MRNFDYVQVGSPEEALRTLAAADGKSALLLAGGTDLIPLAKDNIVGPELLVDISGWAAGAGIEDRGGSLVIGARTPLSAMATDKVVLQKYTALAQACNLAATPQLRNMGTIAGNLLQQTRCWYYRGPFECWLKGGENCFARNGENEHHAIFQTSQSPCVSAHPSDPASALLVLDARVRFTSSAGDLEIALEELFALPEPSRRSFSRLPSDAFITSVILPAATSQLRSTYVKAMPRAAWAFALAGVAIAIEAEGERIKWARVALSGLAPVPFRAREVESALVGQPVNKVDHAALAEILVADAEPLSQNKYKVTLLRGVFTEALEVVCQLF